MSRSKWKGPYFKKNNFKTRNKIQEIEKKFTIIPFFVGSYVKVYTGKKFIKINITENMIGHKIGEFIPTRERFEFKKNKKQKK
jgi:small subunit ribosomal protein S19